MTESGEEDGVAGLNECGFQNGELTPGSVGRRLPSSLYIG